MRLAELEIFVAAAEAGSFSGAADRLHLSQPAVSQNIRSLETAFRVQLFERVGRRVRLSEAGSVLLPMAREVLEASLHLEDTMGKFHGEVAGDLIVGCSTTSGKYVLPAMMATFRVQYPAVHLRVPVFGRDEIYRRLLDERLRLGVMSRLIEHRDLEFQPLFEDRVILVAPPSHPWSQFGRALPADLVDQPLILREGPAGTTEVVADVLSRHGISTDQLNVIFELGNAEAIALAVEEGIGLAFLSELAVARSLALGRLKAIEVEGLDMRRMIYLARTRRHPLTRVEERFWRFVAEKAPSLEPAHA